MNSTADQLVRDYLKRLDAELADLPRARRRELVQEISGHISEARADLPTETEAEIRTLLDRTGDPADIAVEARERFGVQRKRSGALEVVALILLLIGGVVIPVVGWLVGVVLLWVSEAWNTRDKLIGTLVVPGGLLLPLGLALFATSSETCVQTSTGPSECTSGTSTLRIALAVALLVAPFVTTAYLARRRRPVSAAA
jgi:hypothetical protein